MLEGKDFVSFEDRHNMPYVQVLYHSLKSGLFSMKSNTFFEFTIIFIQAVTHESLRVSNTVPLSVFHTTTKETELMAYSIPKVRDTPLKLLIKIRIVLGIADFPTVHLKFYLKL